MKSGNPLPKLSREAVLMLKEISQDGSRMISHTVSRGVVSIRTGGKNLISDSSRTPERWEMALRELISAKLIANIGIPDVYKLTDLGYRAVDRISNLMDNQANGFDDHSNLVPNMEKEKKTKKIFISYRRSDSADVSGRIYDRLIQSFTKESIFKDVDSIPLGRDFRDILDEAINQSDVVLVIIGPQWLKVKDADGNRRLDNSRDYVRIEVEIALERKIPVIPILVQGATMPFANELPLAIRDLAYRNALPVRPDPDFHTDMDRLIRKL